MSSSSKFIQAACAVATALSASCIQAYDDSKAVKIDPPAHVSPLPASEIDVYAKAFLDAIQPISFAQSREYCGFFVKSPDGTVSGTAPRQGTAASCISGRIPSNAIGSYHTHGGYLPNYFNEVPSIEDAVGAMQVQLNEYVSTPGGRFWRIDSATGRARTLCGLGCLTQDPIFRKDFRFPIGNDYTLKQLRALQG